MATNQFLKCGLINIQSVRNKTQEIRELIVDECYDIFCVTETWLDELDTAVIKEMTPLTFFFSFTENQQDRWRSGTFPAKFIYAY